MFRFLIHFAGNLITAAAVAGLLARFVPPDAFWPPAVIALLLPGLLLFTFFYALYVVLRKSWKWVAFPVVVLALSLPIIPQLFTVNVGGGSVAEPESTVTVVTANLRSLRDDDWSVVPVDKAFDRVEAIEPDILLLQESTKGAGKTKIDAFLNKELSLSQVQQPDKKTVATYASRLKPISTHFEGKAYNGFIVSDVTTDVGIIRVVNAHLQSNQITSMASQIGDDRGDLEKEVNRAGSMFKKYARAAVRRAGQADEIRAIIRDSPHPVIVGGDFNDVPSSYTYRKTLTPRLRDAWVEGGIGLGTTFTGPIPGLRIDYLMVDTALTIHSVQRMETGFSDHRGLVIKIARR